MFNCLTNKHDTWYFEHSIRFDYAVIWLLCRDCETRYRYDYWMKSD